MTSANLSTERTARPKAPFGWLFGFTLRQHWTTALLYSIIFFFVLPVPVLMVLTEFRDSSRYPNNLINDLTDWSEYIRYATTPILSVLAIIMAIVLFQYLKNKVSVDFYHSLPLKRDRLYINQLASGALILAVPFFVMLLFTGILIAVNGVMTGEILYNMLIVLRDTLLYALLFYSIGTLVGMVCGLSFVQLLLTLVALFILPAIHAVTVLYLDIFVENMWTDWYFNADLFRTLSPVLKFFIDLAEEGELLRIADLILFPLISAALLVGGYFVYRYRRSERAGTPVVFPLLGSVIKYILVYLGTLLGSLLFYYITDSLFWTIFGMVCGGLLVFMLANTILFKTAKAMFKGWKHLCIWGAIAAVAFLILLTNAFGINDYVPTPGNLSRVEVSFGYSGAGPLTFRDSDVMKAVRNVYLEGLRVSNDPFDWKEENTVEIAPVDMEVYEYEYRYLDESIRMEVVFYPKFGLPVAKSLWIYETADAIDDFRIILDSDEFEAQIQKHLNDHLDWSSSRARLSLDAMSLSIKDNAMIIDSIDNYTTREATPEALRLLESLKKDYTDIGFDTFQKNVVGEVSLRNDSYDYVYLPIMLDMNNTLPIIRNLGLSETDFGTFTDLILAAVDKITVTDRETGQSLTFQKESELRQILDHTRYPISSFNGFSFAFTESRYTVTYAIKAKNYNHRVDDGSVPDASLCQTRFFIDQVPAFITEAFGK